MPRESPVNAPVSVRAKAVTGTTPSSSKSPVVGLSFNGVALTLVGTDLSSYPANTATEFATLDRDRECDLQINSVYVGDVEIYFDLPAGLRLLIDGRPLLTHNYDGGNVATEASETVKIVVTSGRPPPACWRGVRRHPLGGPSAPDQDRLDPHRYRREHPK